MSSRTGQLGFGWRGALLAVVLGAGWGCAQIINADFDTPLKPGEGSGGNGSTSAQGTGTPGGETSTASGDTSGTSSSTSSTSSTGAGGVGGATSSSSSSGTGSNETTIYVGLTINDSKCSPKHDADSVLITDKMEDVVGELDPVLKFQVSTVELPGTIGLYLCKLNGDQRASIGTDDPCAPGSSGISELKTFYVSKTQVNPSYERLKKLTAKDGSNAFVIETPTYNEFCCHSNPSCSDESAFVLPQ